jgi:biotin carboxyl carrier protein
VEESLAHRRIAIVRYSVSISGNSYDIELSESEGRWHCRLHGRDVAIDFAQINSETASILIDGKSYAVRREAGGIIFVGGDRFEYSVEDPRSWQGRKRRAVSQSGPQKLTASMPGKVVRVLAREGENVQVGQGIVILEAMKMQNEIKSPKAGILQKVLARVGANVNPGEVLAVIE